LRVGGGSKLCLEESDIGVVTSGHLGRHAAAACRAFLLACLRECRVSVPLACPDILLLAGLRVLMLVVVVLPWAVVVSRTLLLAAGRGGWAGGASAAPTCRGAGQGALQSFTEVKVYPVSDQVMFNSKEERACVYLGNHKSCLQLP
jgi:hypothetical protein